MPGEILREYRDDSGLRLGVVRFGGAQREACLEFVPEAKVGDYVIVHVGVAISTVSQAEAEETFRYLAELEAAAGAAP